MYRNFTYIIPFSIICILSFYGTISKAQSLFKPERIIKYSDGLVDENITCIAQDESGMM